MMREKLSKACEHVFKCKVFQKNSPFMEFSTNLSFFSNENGLVKLWKGKKHKKNLVASLGHLFWHCKPCGDFCDLSSRFTIEY